MKSRLAILLVVLPLFISHMTHGGETKQKIAAATQIATLPFDSVAPLPGALTISADGRIAAHIAISGDIVIWDALQTKQLKTILAGGKQPSAIALSPDGNMLGIGYADSQLIIQSLLEKRPLREFYGHSGEISALSFSLDGQLLASGGGDATTQLWVVATGKRLHVFDSMLNGGSGIPVSIGFSGNGKVLLVNEWYSRHYDVERRTTLWDIEEGIEISTRDVASPNNDNTVRAGHALGGNGWLLTYTGGWLADKTGLMFERLDQCDSPHQLPSGGYADTVAVDPLGRWVAATDHEKINFFDVNDGKNSYAIALPSTAITLVPSLDGRSVFALIISDTQRNGNEHFIFGRDAETVTGARLYRIPVPRQLWNLPPLSVKKDATHCEASETARLQQGYKFPEQPPKLDVAAKFSAPSQMMAGANPYGGRFHSGYPRELYFSYSGNLFVFYQGYNSTEDFSRSGVVEWSLETQQPLRARFESPIDGEFIIRLREGWAEATERLVNILTGKPFTNISNSDNKSVYLHSSVMTDPDTGMIISAKSGHFERYSPDGQRLENVKSNESIQAFSARNGRLAALYLNGSVQVWQINPLGESQVFKLLESEAVQSVGDLALSADGRYLRVVFANASGDAPDEYVVYNLSTANSVGDGDLLAPFPSRSNRGVVADTRTHRIAVWDYDKGAVIARLPRHRNRDTSGAAQQLRVAISDNGNLVASASRDGVVRVWDIDARQMVGEGQVGGEVTSIAFDSAGQQLAVGRKNAQIVVFQIGSSK